MVETFSTASSGLASTLFIGMLCLCCLTLLWVFADQPSTSVPGRDDEDRPAEWSAKTDWTSRRTLHRVMRFLSIAIAVLSMALIFGAAVAFIGNKLLEAAR
ncbi:MAG: hypothetical protein A2W35_08955 [Chloroflexi bacterium RBG_16_57_11]|nr:MAG: hypothetical protein A2W35_08955 [Chloroflexi bacterium RBG_16_57_11]